MIGLQELSFITLFITPESYNIEFCEEQSDERFVNCIVALVKDPTSAPIQSYICTDHPPSVASHPYNCDNPPCG